jgi:hypothetical protein
VRIRADWLPPDHFSLINWFENWGPFLKQGLEQGLKKEPPGWGVATGGRGGKIKNHASRFMIAQVPLKKNPKNWGFFFSKNVVY